jgi:pyridoxamine 5'-phosphate oxidase
MELKNKVDPIKLFKKWFKEAQEKEIRDPNAMQIATVSESGFPSVRTVLLKDIINRTFVFYTNYESRKSKEIFETKKTAICFYWKSINRQVRVVGEIKKISEEISDQYFSTRSLGSKIGAWASMQSQPLKNRETLLNKVEELKKKFDQNVPRPKHWGGFQIIPNEFEFWQDGDFRLHDRFILKPIDQSNLWKCQRHYP